MMLAANEDFATRELSIEELDTVAAGGLGSAIGAGMRSGGFCGAFTGAPGFIAGMVGGGLMSGLHYFLGHLDED